MLFPRFDDVRVLIRQLIGEDLGTKIQPIWHLDDEGEISGVYLDRDAAPNIWPMLRKWLLVCIGLMSSGYTVGRCLIYDFCC